MAVVHRVLPPGPGSDVGTANLNPTAAATSPTQTAISASERQETQTTAAPGAAVDVNITDVSASEASMSVAETKRSESTFTEAVDRNDLSPVDEHNVSRTVTVPLKHVQPRGIVCLVS